MLEVIVAMALLSICLVSAMSVAALSMSKAEKTKSKWGKQHMLTQAAEFFLLAGNDAAIPDDVFPWKDYQAFCIVEEPEDLPAGLETSVGKWKLVSLKIVLRDIRRNEDDSISVEKIFREEGL